jgi:hypothetical protein
MVWDVVSNVVHDADDGPTDSRDALHEFAPDTAGAVARHGGGEHHRIANSLQIVAR